MYRTLYFVVFLALLFGLSGQAEAERLAYWKLDDGAGTDVYDATGNGYDGTLMGNPVWTTGVYGGALEFDGSGDYVDFGNPADWPEGAEPRSLTGWALTYSIGSGWRWIAAYGSAGTGLACFIGLNAANLYGGGYGDDIYNDQFLAGKRMAPHRVDL